MGKIHTSKILYQLRQILGGGRRSGVTSRNIHEFKHLAALLHVYAGESVALTESEKDSPARAARAAMKAKDTVRVQAICLHISNQWHLCRGDLPWALDEADNKREECGQ